MKICLQQAEKGRIIGLMEVEYICPCIPACDLFAPKIRHTYDRHGTFIALHNKNQRN